MLLYFNKRVCVSVTVTQIYGNIFGRDVWPTDPHF